MQASWLLQLKQEQHRLKSFSIAKALEEDPQRCHQMQTQAAGLHLDYSKQLLDTPCLKTLLEIARLAKLPQAIQALFDGEQVNTTEKRAALHTLLRTPEDQLPNPDLKPLHKQVLNTQKRMQKLAEQVFQQRYYGASGKAIDTIVNIGIGGSDLGPTIIYQALKPLEKKPLEVFFVSNADPQQLTDTLASIKADTTLFIIASKSFTTQETLSNAKAAKSWLQTQLGASKEVVARHCIAVTAAIEKAERFGIERENIYPMWDWVGGRYSVWSAMGLSLALSLGWSTFTALLHGAHTLDKHFKEAEFTDNMPVIMALLSVWNTSILGAQSLAIAPYSQALARLPAYLQQLVMESNGKSCRHNGEIVNYPTSPLIWGEPGTNSQHSFFQLLHQGSHLIPVDFILPLAPAHKTDSHRHKLLIGNCLAQARALMLGSDGGDNAKLKPHKKMPGNRPSNIISFHRLSAETLGALIALYEHKTYVESVLWDINAFDQWGVELGKLICSDILAQLDDYERPMPKLDASTKAMLKRYKQIGSTDK